MTQSVTLISVSQPRDIAADANELISYCARVSNPQNQENFDTSDKLLAYCVRNQHWSIFEMVHLVYEINTTRDIGRQILRHRSFSFQEFSQRYAKPTDLGTTLREARLQDPKNRQNSIENEDDTTQFRWNTLQLQTLQAAMAAYNEAIKIGLAKEVARAVLPEGLTMSRMYMAGSLRSYIHYCRLRMGNGTQKEHREIATMIWKILEVEFPFLKDI